MDDVPTQQRTKGSRIASMGMVALAGSSLLLAWTTSHSLGHLTAAVCFLAMGPAAWYQPLNLREHLRTAFTHPPFPVPAWARVLCATGQIGLIATILIAVLK
jgi:hypothetical protein